MASDGAGRSDKAHALQYPSSWTVMGHRPAISRGWKAPFFQLKTDHACRTVEA